MRRFALKKVLVGGAKSAPLLPLRGNMPRVNRV